MAPFDFACSSLGIDLACYDFMQNALLAASLVGIAAPSIGIYLVQRRLSLMGDGIGHVAFTGVAAGLLAGIFPVATALVAAVIGAVVIELLRERGRTAGDVALALVFYGGLAGGVLLASKSAAGAKLLPYLFGSVLSVKDRDLILIAVASLAIVGMTILLHKELFAVTYDEEVARVSGLRVRAYNLLVAITAAVTVAVSMRVVGILLVSSMLVLPVAAVQQVTRSFRSTVLFASLVGFGVSVGGLIAAWYLDAAPGGTIVLSAIAAFAVARLAVLLRRTPASGRAT